jgi:hypothetical protein
MNKYIKAKLINNMISLVPNLEEDPRFPPRAPWNKDSIQKLLGISDDTANCIKSEDIFNSGSIGLTINDAELKVQEITTEIELLLSLDPINRRREWVENFNA